MPVKMQTASIETLTTGGCRDYGVRAAGPVLSHHWTRCIRVPATITRGYSFERKISFDVLTLARYQTYDGLLIGELL